MSIATEITRLQNAKASIKSAIENKGVSVPSSTLLDGYANLIAQISGGGSTGLEYETGIYEPTTDEYRPTINFTNSHSVPPTILTMYDATGTNLTDTNSNIANTYIDVYRLTGVGYNYNAQNSNFRYATLHYTYRGTSATSINSGTQHFSYNSDNTNSSSSSYPRYWVSYNNFHPYSNSSSRYWRAGRTYKWVAVWT